MGKRGRQYRLAGLFFFSFHFGAACLKKVRYLVKHKVIQEQLLEYL